MLTTALAVLCLVLAGVVAYQHRVVRRLRTEPDALEELRHVLGFPTELSNR